MENEDAEQEQQQLSEGDGSVSVSKQETAPRRDRSNPTEHVRLWVLEMSASGLIDTPRMHTVRNKTIKPTTLVRVVVGGGCFPVNRRTGDVSRFLFTFGSFLDWI